MQKTKQPKKTRKANRPEAFSLKILKNKPLIITYIFVMLILLMAVSMRINRALSNSDYVLPKSGGNLVLTNFKWRQQPSSIARYAPDKGMEYISVDISLMHLRNQTVWFAPVLESFIKDDGGNKYGIQAFDLKAPFIAGNYVSNQLASGELGYMIPINNKKLTWCYFLADNEQNDKVCVPLVKDNKNI